MTCTSCGGNAAANPPCCIAETRARLGLRPVRRPVKPAPPAPKLVLVP